MEDPFTLFHYLHDILSSAFSELFDDGGSGERDYENESGDDCDVCHSFYCCCCVGGDGGDCGGEGDWVNGNDAAVASGKRVTCVSERSADRPGSLAERGRRGAVAQLALRERTHHDLPKQSDYLKKRIGLTRKHKKETVRKDKGSQERARGNQDCRDSKIDFINKTWIAEDMKEITVTTPWTIVGLI